MSERSIHKTIRISKDVYDYIEDFPGDSWNDRFNNMVQHVLYFESDRERKKKNLDQEIEQRQERLNELDQVIRDAKKALGVLSRW